MLAAKSRKSSRADYLKPGSTSRREPFMWAREINTSEDETGSDRCRERYKPLKQAFSKLKAHLRKTAERTIPRLSRRIGALSAEFSPQECANYFRHAGYAST